MDLEESYVPLDTSLNVYPDIYKLLNLSSDISVLYQMNKKWTNTKMPLNYKHDVEEHKYGSVYVPLHVLFIFYLSTLILDKSNLNSEKSTLEFKVVFPRLKSTNRKYKKKTCSGTYTLPYTGVLASYQYICAFAFVLRCGVV